ncbi:cytochrome b/b6 domain-containing protein [Dechloromonas denitrificans]|uniref:cytochrome b/b6 domain-containing protein n=1 Tax=Dechloromonas denitrificans TaxID=281362 RepID=UPI001CF90C0D|nr:cytochrome b/b6 domain-containing protein [Dechloromonas denitrificans]UCV04753.1 cytochrome b/b6 domain-containing protein [Dechloromonas denitrificans]
MNSKKIRLWDLPTRLFHWLLVLCVLAAVVSGQLGGNLIDWHGRIGLLIVGLLVFRLVWGIVGSTYARFRQFVPTPARIKAYLRGEWQGEGHNPLGALAVFGLLGLLIAQVLSGLFSNDDIAFVGPLFDLVSKNLSNRLTGIHHLLSNLLIALVVLHVAAIAFYARVKKQSLVKPMITGWKQGEGESASGGGWLALIVALVLAGAGVYGASGAWLPEPPPPPPAAETPSW